MRIRDCLKCLSCGLRRHRQRILRGLQTNLHIWMMIESNEGAPLIPLSPLEFVDNLASDQRAG